MNGNKVGASSARVISYLYSLLAWPIHPLYLDIPSHITHWTPTTTPSLHGDPSHLSKHEQEQQFVLEMSTSTPDTLIAGLSWRPGFILRSGIFIYEGLVKPTILPRTPPSSSLGLLDVLPIELLRLVLNSSDFQSLSRFARVCHQAKTLVESLLSYQDIMKHAFTALFALSLSKLIKFHTAANTCSLTF